MKFTDKIQCKVVTVKDVIDTWTKQRAYGKNIDSYDKDTKEYLSKKLECDRCKKIRYTEDEKIYLFPLKNKGFCEKCIKEFEDSGVIKRE